jgi:hypothetical protein
MKMEIKEVTSAVHEYAKFYEQTRLSEFVKEFSSETLVAMAVDLEGEHKLDEIMGHNGWYRIVSEIAARDESVVHMLNQARDKAKRAKLTPAPADEAA